MRALNATWSAEVQAEGEDHLRHWDLSKGGRHWSPQHPARAWEYYLALLAAGQEAPHGGLYLDVGGAGSPLSWMFAGMLLVPMQVIDPEFNGLGMVGNGHWPHALIGKADFISCISVIEHVECEQEFLIELVSLLAPGGVLFLTTDYDPSGAPEDKFQFHWMRKRIYSYKTFFQYQDLASLRTKLETLGLKILGDQAITPLYEDTIPGLGYSFASLCMRKEA